MGPWRCMFAAQSGLYLPMPVFMLQPKFDSWQIGSELGTDDAAEVNAYGAALERDLMITLQAPRSERLTGLQRGSGVFLDSQKHHTAMPQWDGCDPWKRVKINGVAMNTAVEKWLASMMMVQPLGKDDDMSWVSDEPYECSTCCA